MLFKWVGKNIGSLALCRGIGKENYEEPITHRTQQEQDFRTLQQQPTQDMTLALGTRSGTLRPLLPLVGC